MIAQLEHRQFALLRAKGEDSDSRAAAHVILDTVDSVVRFCRENTVAVVAAYSQSPGCLRLLCELEKLSVPPQVLLIQESGYPMDAALLERDEVTLLFGSPSAGQWESAVAAAFRRWERAEVRRAAVARISANLDYSSSETIFTD